MLLGPVLRVSKLLPMAIARGSSGGRSSHAPRTTASTWAVVGRLFGRSGLCLWLTPSVDGLVHAGDCSDWGYFHLFPHPQSIVIYFFTSTAVVQLYREGPKMNYWTTCT